jgi:hypothetical protein
MGTVSPPGMRIDLDVLALVLRSMFPHHYFPDGPYWRTAAAIAVSAEVDPRTAAQLEQGLVELGAAEFAALDDHARFEYLSEIADSTFFETIRSQAILVLYNDPEVWELLGYEVPA